MKISDFIGGKTTTAAKITSSIVSIIILGFIYISSWIPQIPKNLISLGYAWLAIHIVDHLFVAISEIETKRLNRKR